MRLSRLLPLLLLVATIAGCQTMTPEERRAADETTCLRYGFKRGTDAFASCLQRIDLDRHEEDRAFRAQAWSNYPFYLGDGYGRRWHGPY